MERRPDRRGLELRQREVLVRLAELEMEYRSGTLAPMAYLRRRDVLKRSLEALRRRYERIHEAQPLGR